MTKRIQFFCLSCIAVASGFMLLAGSRLTALQAPADRLVYVVVRTPNNKVVTGLEQRNFNVTEHGIPRPITYFGPDDSPATIAIVGAVPLMASANNPGSELIQAATVAEAVQKLAAAKNVRKALVVPPETEIGQIPAGIQVVRTSGGDLPRAMIELRNSYLLGFTSSDPASTVDVKLSGTERLPPLSLTIGN